MNSWKKVVSRIPSNIQIGKSNYEILWSRSYISGKNAGETRFDNQKQILISTNQSKKEIAHTYFHEVLHAMSNEYGANLSEKQVLALEKGIEVFLRRDNLFSRE